MCCCRYTQDDMDKLQSLLDDVIENLMAPDHVKLATGKPDIRDIASESAVFRAIDAEGII